MLKQSAALLLLASGTALAADPTIGFNHLGAKYISSDADSADGDGFGIDLNVALTDYLFADLDFNSRKLEGNGTGADLEFFSAGIGGNYALNAEKTVQLFAGISWEQIDVTLRGAPSGGGDGDGGDDGDGDDGGGAPFGSCNQTGTPLDQLFSAGGGALGLCDPESKALSIVGSEREDGFGGTLGIRALVWETLEVGAHYDFRDYGDGNDETIYGVNLTYSYDNWGAVLSYDSYDELEIDEILLGVRYTFGNSDDGSSSIW